MKKSLVTVLLLTLYGCGGGGETDNSPIPVEPESYSLTGNFEKGPFIIGSEITIQEFDDNLVSTGKTFHTETISNTGNYNMDLSLTEELVEVSADGYYFNEISGELSNSKLRLSALANVSDNENVNINILTHLSKKRIKTLVSDGKSFPVAKKQAEEEVQELFDFVAVDWEINDFDRMSISEAGDNNSYLLLVSSIIQNINMSTSALSEYIERVAQDLSDNGVVNDNDLVEPINLSAQNINLSIVRTNLTTRYDELGEAINLPDFELLINRAPVADAGDDNQESYVNTEITLDGSNSSDIDSDNLSYAWALFSSPESSEVTLTDSNTVSPSIKFDMPGTYQISLTVDDGELFSNVDIVKITTDNRPPVAETQEEFSIVVGESITLDASNSYDPDGDQLTYQWASCTYYNESYPCEINNETVGSGMTFDAGILPPAEPYDNDIGEFDPELPKLRFKLVVTDPDGLSSNKNVTITYTSNFIDNGNGTISDGFGGIWQQGSSDHIEKVEPEMGSLYFGAEFSEYCNDLVIGGYTDWRVPDKFELFRLVSTGSPSINTNFFPETYLGFYRTSSWPYGVRASFIIDFSNNGSAHTAYPTGAKRYVRCIR